jgi:hypothetical protein
VRSRLLLLAATFLVYNANVREISSLDTLPMRLLPVSLIEDRRLDLDRFVRGLPLADAWPVQFVGGHFLSAYPIVPALLAVPVYAVPVSVLGGDSWVLVNALAKLSASLLATLSVLMMYLVLRRMGAEEQAVAATVVYALGTSTWSVSSQGLWQHAPAQLFLALALYGVLRASQQPRWAGLTGLSVGVMVAARPTMWLVGLALLAAAWTRDRRQGTLAAALCAAALLPVVWYNVGYFGSLQGGYAKINASHQALHGVEGMWSTPLGEGLLGLLFSPSRGLFVYSPVLLFACWGLWRAVSAPDARRDLYRWLAGGLAATLVMLGMYSVWWGGHSFGPRLLADLLPLFAVFLPPVLERVQRSRLLRVAFLALFLVSVIVQLIGVFYYPSASDVDWNSVPENVDFAHHRLWDWQDTQLIRLLRNGPRPLGFVATGS